MLKEVSEIWGHVSRERLVFLPGGYNSKGCACLEFQSEVANCVYRESVQKPTWLLAFGSPVGESSSLLCSNFWEAVLKEKEGLKSYVFLIHQDESL